MALKSIGRFIVTSDVVDRDSERMVPSGARFNNFEKHPVMLWNHNRSRSWDDGVSKKLLPIGRWENMQSDDSGISFEGFVSDTTEFGKEIIGLCEDKVLNATSIGFIPIKWSNDVKDKLPGQEGYTITDYEVIEISLADIPANPEATRKSFTKSEGNEELEVFSSMGEFVKSGKETGVIVKSFSPQSTSKKLSKVDKFLKNIASVLGITNVDASDETMQTEIKSALEKPSKALIDKVASTLKNFQKDELEPAIKKAVDEAVNSLVSKVDKLGTDLKYVQDENVEMKKQLKNLLEADDDAGEGDRIEPPKPSKKFETDIIDLSKHFLDV